MPGIGEHMVMRSARERGEVPGSGEHRVRKLGEVPLPGHTQCCCCCCNATVTITNIFVYIYIFVYIL